MHGRKLLFFTFASRKKTVLVENSRKRLFSSGRSPRKDKQCKAQERGLFRIIVPMHNKYSEDYRADAQQEYRGN